MPDERQDSIRQGIHAPDESPSGAEAAEQRRQRAAQSPPIGGAMGGTSDADRPGDEALFNAQRGAGLGDEGGEAQDGGEMPAAEQKLVERNRVLKETREAGQRAQGGGDADEQDIRSDADRPS
jgi:hypothetical protein